ncbi:MAG: tripartite tricarboxylate transporter permease [Xanthobacteraceae bacterium]
MADTLHNLVVGFEVVLAPSVLLYACLGCVIGTIVGVLPGLGPLAGISILLPLSFGLPPTTAIVLLAGIYYGAMYGGSTTSILMRIPGEAASVVTCIDGYEMTRQGRAGPALAIAAIGSFVAGTLSVVALMLLAPPLARLALAFGPPEYLALLLMGLTVLSSIGSDPMPKTLTMAALGLLLGTIGIDPMSGYNRFSGGIPELADGLGVVPLAVGLFGLSEIMLAYGNRATQPVGRPRLSELMPSREEARLSIGPVWRGTVIGFLIGIIPGSAHILSSFVSYAIERRLSPHPERFGKGAVEGVAGPESANNAAASGAFVPMLALGVPLGPVQAILIAVLIVHGIAPGPLLVAQQPQLFWGFIASMYVGNLVLLVLNLPLVGLFVWFLRLPYAYLYPVVLVCCLVGVYTVNFSMVDVLIMAAAGAGGYALRRLRYDVAPVVLGFILAPMLEMAFRQSLAMSGGDYMIFFERPIATALLAVGILVPFLGAVPALMRRRGWKEASG